MKQKTNIQKLKLGVFIIVGTLLFVLAIYTIGQKQNLFSNSFILKTQFNNINGLQKGNNVRFSGIEIGTVSSIKMLNDSTIIVEMNIEEKITTHIKKNAIASIGTDGIVGNVLINIFPRNGVTFPIENGDIIELADGTFTISQSLIINKTLTIQSKGNSEIIYTGAANTPALALHPYGKLTFKNIKLKGNKTNIAFASLKENMFNHFGLNVTNCEISNFNYALKVYKQAFSEEIMFKKTSILNWFRENE